MNRPVFSFSAPDADEAGSPVLGSSSFKDPPPPHDTESSDGEDALPKQKSNKSYHRSRMKWQKITRFSDCIDATMGEDEMKICSLLCGNSAESLLINL